MELVAELSGVKIYNDFAHHPTAITETLRATRQMVGSGKIICILEPRSNTMRMGAHKTKLSESLTDSDAVYIYNSNESDWNLTELSSDSIIVVDSTQSIIDQVCKQLQSEDTVIVMSNGGFENLITRLVDQASESSSITVN